MFIERNIAGNKKTGSVEIISGSMFSGKTEELIRRIKRARIARQSIEIYKPKIDVRYSETEVISHDENVLESTLIENSANILLLTNDADVIGIDEAQFLDKGLVDVVNELADRGTRVIVAGLDMDFKGVPFGPMPALMAIADHVTKVHAVCIRCGNIAQFSHRLNRNEQIVLLGEKESYEPLCRTCYNDAQKND